MTELKSFKIRPSLRANSNEIFRVYVSRTVLFLLGLSIGDTCHLQQTPDGTSNMAIIWLASDKIKDNCVQISKALQSLYGFKLGEEVYILCSNATIIDASSITLCEVPQTKPEILLPVLDETQRMHWVWILEYTLQKAEILSPGLILYDVEAKGQKRAFKIQEINSNSTLSLFHPQPECKIRIVDENVQQNQKALVASMEGLGGLETQFQKINDILAAYDDNGYSAAKSMDYRPLELEGGILLYGPSGTGKTEALRRISKAGWQRAFHIGGSSSNRPSGETKDELIRRLFSAAQLHQPSIIIIDDLDFILDDGTIEARNRASGLAYTLREAMESVADCRTLVVAATESLNDVNRPLRRSRGFEYEVEIPMPDSQTRAQILKNIRRLPKDVPDSTLDNVAKRTPGFAGVDLDLLIKKAMSNARRQYSTSGDLEIKPIEGDFNSALVELRPFVMQKLSMQIPNVRWTEIGGQKEAIEELKEELMWLTEVCAKLTASYLPKTNSSKNPHILEQYGLSPKKGLLLYGPPGCSKTMIARAAATESGANFFPIKGAELLNKYVGESERAIREIFKKARAARPSIIFFDEIDALASNIDGGQPGTPHTVSTLLTELDGIEELRGVYVLAATNSPELLHPALLRAGRLEKTVYVGLPDQKARRDILQIRMTKLQHADDVDFDALSKATEGLSGAEIKHMCDRACASAASERVRSATSLPVGQSHFVSALETLDKSITTELLVKYKVWGAGRRFTT